MHQSEATRPQFSIVLPARNEEHRIGDTLHMYQDYFKANCKAPYEIIVVANACTDGTVGLVKSIAEKMPILRFFECDLPGKGRAILEGIHQAQGRVVLFCDSDGATEASDILGLIESVNCGRCDCAIGSRWLSESKVPVRQTFKRRVASRLFNLAVRVIFGFPYKDTQCGAKAFNSKALEIIQSRVTSYGYQFDCEVLWRLRQAGLRVAEIPITWRERGGSGIHLGRDGLQMLWELLKIRFQLRPGKGRLQ